MQNSVNLKTLKKCANSSNIQQLTIWKEMLLSSGQFHQYDLIIMNFTHSEWLTSQKIPQYYILQYKNILLLSFSTFAQSCEARIPNRTIDLFLTYTIIISLQYLLIHRLCHCTLSSLAWFFTFYIVLNI